MPSGLRPLAALLGTWRGEGHGEYPTIEPFDYGEEVTFSHVGKPFLAYAQRTWSLQTGAPLHAETGFWRPGGDGLLEVVLSHPFGAVEVLTGSVHDGALRLASSAVVTTPTAQRIDGTERDVDVAGGTLHYTLRMAAAGHPMTHHLAAVLRRVQR
ncbi:MAG: FABP family protein [Egibacteraceae bacterium]